MHTLSAIRSADASIVRAARCIAAWESAAIRTGAGAKPLNRDSGSLRYAVMGKPPGCKRTERPEL